MLKAAGCCEKDLSLHTWNQSQIILPGSCTSLQSCTCVSPPTAPSHSLLHALDWDVPLQQQPAYLWDRLFAKDLCSSKGFIQKAFRESGLPSTGKLYGVLQHFITLLGILRNVEESFNFTFCSLYMTYSRKPMKLQHFWKQCLWKSGPNTSTKVANFL